MKDSKQSERITRNTKSSHIQMAMSIPIASLCTLSASRSSMLMSLLPQLISIGLLPREQSDIYESKHSSIIYIE